MLCDSCQKQIPSDKSGFIVCPNCGYVNLSNAQTKTTFTHMSGVRVTVHSNKKKVRISSRKYTPILAGFSILLFIGLIITTNMVIHAMNPKKQSPKPTEIVTKTPETTQTEIKPAQKPETLPKVISPEVSATGIKQPKVAERTVNPTSPAPTLTSVLTSINQQLQRFGVVATLNPGNDVVYQMSWSSLTENDAISLQVFSAQLIQEFGKYPTDFVKNSNLKTIGLVRNLRVATIVPAAAPVPTINNMLYDIPSMVQSGESYSREVIHHEYWHYIDYKISGSFYSADPSWSACNPAGFQYGNGGQSAYLGGYTAQFHPRAGIITQYSTYGIEEDRAEMFGWLMYSPSSVKDLNDSGINCKINRLTTLARSLSPSMTF